MKRIPHYSLSLVVSKRSNRIFLSAFHSFSNDHKNNHLLETDSSRFTSIRNSNFDHVSYLFVFHEKLLVFFFFFVRGEKSKRRRRDEHSLVCMYISNGRREGRLEEEGERRQLYILPRTKEIICRPYHNNDNENLTLTQSNSKIFIAIEISTCCFFSNSYRRRPFKAPNLDITFVLCGERMVGRRRRRNRNKHTRAKEILLARR